MAEEKVTTMVLNMDSQYSKCYKKVTKLLCNFPEIQHPKYDEKANKVTIKVVSCSPEKIRDELRCQGGRWIKSIEIKADGKPPTPPPPHPPQPWPRPLLPPPHPPQPWPRPRPPPPPPCKDKRRKASVDLHVQGSCYCKFCSRRPWGPCPCGGQVQCALCYGTPVYDSWCVYETDGQETQLGCTIM